MTLELRVVSGALAGLRLPLAEGRHSLGRAAECDLRIPDRSVSRPPAWLLVRDGAVVVLRVTPGQALRVGGAPVATPYDLPVGQVFEMGGALLMVARDGCPPPAAEAPDPCDLADRARLRLPSLWKRGAADPLALRLGWGDLPGLRAAPIVVDAGALAVAGREPEVAGLVRWLIVQAACLHPPGDLAIAAATGGEAWEWVGCLPHAVDGPVEERILDAGRTGRRLLVVVGQEAPGSARLVQLALRARGVHTLLFGDAAAPAAFTARAFVDAAANQLSLWTDGRELAGVPDQVGLDLAREVARDLAATAPLEHAEAPPAPAAEPDRPGAGWASLHRPARALPAPVPDQPVTVVAAPGEQPRTGTWWPQLLFPLVTSFGSAYFIVYNRNPTFIAISVTMALASVALSAAMLLQQLSNARRRVAQDRERYLDYLDEIGQEARRTAALQDEAARFLHPAARELWAVARRRVRVWERRLADLDFAAVRIGSGSVPLAAPLQLEGGRDPLTRRDPALHAAAEQVVGEHRTVTDQPLVLDLRAHPVISLVGPPDGARVVARSIVCELATFCAPDDLLIGICRPAGAAPDWEFARWLPHLVPGEGRPPLLGEGPAVVASLAAEVGRRLELARRRHGNDRSAPAERPRRILLVVDGFSATSPLARQHVVAELTGRAREVDASLVFLVEAQRDEPPTVDVRVRVGSDGGLQAGDLRGRLDDVPPVLAEAIARSLSPLRLGEGEAAAALGERCRLVELLGAGSASELDPLALWATRTAQDVLRVPIGAGADGGPEIIDLKEAAQGGMGPHGLVVGATGSGKSELLRTLVTALAATHSPETLGFVLVDFKGGAAFAGLSELPHVSGMITNLADDMGMIDRTHSALFGEMQRRQSLLRRAGNIDSVREYQHRRAAGMLPPDAEPLPYLLIVVDEFGELLASRPDFIELFVAIGRVGRSIGMHLMLASQRMDEGRLRGLESHLSYRICLRTFSAADSHAVIGTPDAYHLPSIPGSGYLKVHTEVFERFRAALVSGPDRPAGEPAAARAPGPVLSSGLVVLAGGEPASPAADGDGDGPTEMAVVVDRVRATGAAPVHQVWLPPLEAGVGLDRLLPPLARHPTRGLQALGWPGLGQGRVPVGLVDLPLEQAQRPFLLDLTGWAGHIAVVGAPQSGKSTFLRTLVLSLVATHTPDEARVYVVDYGGGTLYSLAGAPHVGDVAGRLEPEKARRAVTEVWTLLDEREARFRELGIDSPETLRRRRADGSLPAELGCDVYLVLDGWGALREELDDLEPQLRDIATRGLRVACHLVLTANRWYDVRPALRDSIGGRLELRLGDPAESEINRRAAMGVPAGVPGRALAPDTSHVQVALPRLGGALEEVAAQAAAAWPGPGAPAVRLLPRRVSAAELPASDTPGIPIGLEELDLAPAHVDLGGADPHLLVFGDAESGKTTFLRTVIAGLQARGGAARAMFLVVDYRRTLLGAVRPDQMWAYCGAAQPAAAAVRELASGIGERLPPYNLSEEAIRSRSWWSGPDFYVVVDDYDLVASSSAGSPLAPLVEVLAQGRDLGLHVVVARRVGGMARAGMDPLLGRLRELHTQGLILSGDPTEGPVIGTHRATSQPPGRGLLVRRRHRPLLVQTLDVQH